jgi:multiple sugar transport system ATP-binding protein
VPAERSARLAGKRRQAVVLGIRPEDLHPATGADHADLTCEAVVDVVEPLGSEILLDVKVGNCVIVVRVDPSVRLRQHDKIRLAFNPERIHFFDAKTEESLQ